MKLYNFPNGYRNIIRWNPSGDYLLFAGFGNLAGQVTLYKLDSKAPASTLSQSIQVIYDWRDPCTVVCEWSPDAKFLLIASTFPRMKVDNWVKILTFDGELVVSMPFSQLYEALWIIDGSGPVELPTPRPKPIAQPKLPYRPRKKGNAYIIKCTKTCKCKYVISYCTQVNVDSSDNTNTIDSLFEKLSLQKRATTYNLTANGHDYMQAFRKYMVTVKPLSFSNWYTRHLSTDKSVVVVNSKN